MYWSLMLTNTVLLTSLLGPPVHGNDHADTSKRELPLNLECNPLQGTCYKGDLVSTTIADCERNSFLSTCTPQNDYSLSTVVDVPTGSVTCNPASGKPLTCGNVDTRCVCYKAVDYKADIAEVLANQCRCQYWPATDIRSTYPSYCTQYDHGGTSNVHFFACCNNCEDPTDTDCAGATYQGGGTDGDYCDQCGLSSSEGGGRITYRFNCVSCSQQSECADRCDELWSGWTKALPGLCPKWMGCFRGCCVDAAARLRSKRSSTNITAVVVPKNFCGDFECYGDENLTNCPIDCCPTVRPSCDNCTSDSCCVTPGCCLTDTGTAGGALGTVNESSHFFMICVNLCLAFATIFQSYDNLNCQ